MLATPTSMSKKSEFVRVIFKKGGDKPDSAILQRFDGSEVFIQYKPGLVFHDLAHFAIESTLSIRAGFFWLVNQGLTSEDFELPKDQRPTLLTEAMKNPDHVAIEFITNQLMIEATNSGPMEDFIELLQEGMAERQAANYSFRFDDVVLDDIRQLYSTILEGWRMFPPGKEKKVMVYYPGSEEMGS